MRTVQRKPREKTEHATDQPDGKDWRVFCAIEITDQVGDRLGNHIETLQRLSPGASASWGRAGKFHLTLKFLGNISRNRIADLSSAAQRATDAIEPFKIYVGRTGIFPKHGPPRVLWIGVEDSTGTLSRLQRRLEEECSTVGFEAEEREFRPHLTIARLRKPEGAKALARSHLALAFPPVEALIKELHVYRSELGREGSKYTVISSHPFASHPFASDGGFEGETEIRA